MAISFVNVSAQARKANTNLFNAAKGFFEEIRSQVELQQDVIRISDEDDLEMKALYAISASDSTKVLRAGEKPTKPFLRISIEENPEKARKSIYIYSVGGVFFAAEKDNELNLANADSIISHDDGLERDNHWERLDWETWDLIKTYIKLYAEETAE